MLQRRDAETQRPQRTRILLSLCAFTSLRNILLAVVVLVVCEAKCAGLHNEPHLRRPVAVCASDDGKTLLTANRDSGTISIIDVAARAVVKEVAVGTKLADIVACGPNVLAVDEAAHQLIVLRQHGTELKVVARVDVARYPVSVVATPDGQQCFVASLWSRRVSLIDLSTPEDAGVYAEIDTPIAGREQCLLPDGRTLVVADSFGGRLAVVDIPTHRLVNTRELFAHNMRGLAVTRDGKSLLIPHQQLHADEATTEGGVHWGGVLSNVIRKVPVDWFRSQEPLPNRDVFFLGYPDRATGDPTDMVVTESGRQILTYAGVSELAVSDRGANYYEPISVGQRPAAIALSPDERTVYVANTFSDSVSVVDVDRAEVVDGISLGPSPELTAAERGELLFYDASLASDGWFSCHSCHTDGHTNGGLSDNLSDGSFGAPKRVLSLLGVADTGPWAWNGKTESLEEQVRKSIIFTMRGPEPTDRQVSDITAYLRTLPPAPSVLNEDQLDNGAIAAGRRVFERHGCADCHADRAFTSQASYDVDLHDELGNTHFNPPSLRGVSQRWRLFHDNRARSLHKVFTRYQHGLGKEVFPHDVTDLVSYLKSL